MTNYVARYITEKVSGDMANDHYLDVSTGVILTPEYTTMSRKPGIGYTWFRKYADDVYPSYEVIAKGRSQRPPKFYDSQIEKVSEDWLADIKAKRSEEAIKFSSEQTPERLDVREKVKLAKLNLFKRS